MRTSIRSVVERIAERTAPARVVDHEAWKEMVGEGWLRTAVPQDMGGLSGSLRDVALLAEELGRGAVSSPFGAMAATVFGVRIALPELAADLLPRISHASAQVLPVWPEIAGGGEVSARQSNGGWVLRGQLPIVDFADMATHFLAGTLDERDASCGLFLLAAKNPQAVQAELGASISDVPLRQIRFDDLQTGAPVGCSLPALKAKEQVEMHLRALTCSELCGLGTALVEKAADYARSREQFGRPIGSFQAVQHLLANMHIELELASLAAKEFVQRLDEGVPVEHWDDIASSLAGATYTRCALEAHEVFAGVGFIKEHGAHVYTRRAIALSSRLPAYRAINARRATVAVAGENVKANESVGI